MGSVGDWIVGLSSGDPEKAEAAAQQPPKDQESALRVIEYLLAHEEADVRWWAARALAKFKTERAGELLIRAIKDEDQAVRHCAVLALGKHPHVQAIEALVSLIGSEDRMLARLAGDALVAIGDEATPAMLKMLEKGNEAGKVEAARALAKIGDLRSVPALFKILDSNSAMLEHWANEGLEKMEIGMNFFHPGTA